MSDLLAFAAIPELPPAPVLHRVLPKKWISLTRWRAMDGHTGSANWNFAFEGEDFVAESVVSSAKRPSRPPATGAARSSPPGSCHPKSR